MLTGGAQRTLYKLFKDVARVALSSSEKPTCVVAVLSSWMKYPKSVCIYLLVETGGIENRGT